MVKNVVKTHEPPTAKANWPPDVGVTVRILCVESTTSGVGEYQGTTPPPGTVNPGVVPERAGNLEGLDAPRVTIRSVIPMLLRTITWTWLNDKSPAVMMLVDPAKVRSVKSMFIGVV